MCDVIIFALPFETGAVFTSTSTVSYPLFQRTPGNSMSHQLAHSDTPGTPPLPRRPPLFFLSFADATHDILPMRDTCAYGLTRQTFDRGIMSFTD